MSNENRYDEWRQGFLKSLYEVVGGEALKFVEVQKVVAGAGPCLAVPMRIPGVAEGNILLKENFIDGIARTLRRDGLIDIKEDGQQRVVEVALTEKGVQEARSLGLGSI